ncbi:MAG: hypothetical protein H6Q20_1857 [Bacteroidetes bacterium]|nr:hypothetical protein [Bacteroidota bacterium]
MKYLYYKLYQDFKRVKTNNAPAFTSMIVICVMQGVNLITMLLLFFHFFNIKISLTVSENKIFAFILFSIIFGVNYFTLYKNINKIASKYKEESKTKSIIGFILLILYIVGSLGLVYYVGSNYPLFTPVQPDISSFK